MIRHKVAQRCISFINWVHSHTKSSSAALTQCYWRYCMVMYGIDWYIYLAFLSSWFWVRDRGWNSMAQKGLIKALSLLLIHSHSPRRPCKTNGNKRSLTLPNYVSTWTCKDNDAFQKAWHSLTLSHRQVLCLSIHMFLHGNFVCQLNPQLTTPSLLRC